MLPTIPEKKRTKTKPTKQYPPCLPITLTLTRTRSNPHTLTPSVAEDSRRRQRTLICTQSQCEVTEASLRALHSDPFTPIHGTLFLSLSLSLSFSIVKRRSLNQEKLQFFCFKSFNFLCGY